MNDRFVRVEMHRRSLITGLACAALCALAAPANGQVQPYRTNDFGGFRDVLVPGANGRSNLIELAAFLATGARPPHSDDQRDVYARLLSATPGVTNDNIGALQGRELRHRARRPGARLQPARGPDDHP